ncbi:hypothetical protein [Pandoraea sp. ISTKB]|uniref:hypothetical protein n=1 Tax=Pandoraea sp. ISTKB TaxID=1586708 RepID=UPI0009F60063|nr:hypothetical protein [Pandoraea sp. ISTKB]
MAYDATSSDGPFTRSAMMTPSHRNGQPDAGFGTQGHVDIPMASGVSQLLPDGKIISFGTEERHRNGVFAYRHLPNGEIDSAFGTNGRLYITFGDTTGETIYPETAALTNDGKIVLANLIVARPFAGFRLLQVCRIDQNGTLDTTFGLEGKYVIHIPPGLHASFVGMHLLGNGKIIILGNSSQSTIAPPATTFARLTANGLPDSSFGNNGLVPFPAASGVASAFAALPDGRMYTGDRSGISCFDAAANLDPSFGTGGHVPLDFSSDYPALRHWNVSQIVVQADGKLVLAGTVGDTQAEPGKSAVMWTFRLLANGSLDSTFNGGVPVISRLGDGSSYAPFSLAMQADGKIVVAGALYGTSGAVLERLNPSGSRDTTFGNDGIIVEPPPAGDLLVMMRSLAIQPDGKLLTTARSFGVEPALTRLSRYLP